MNYFRKYLLFGLVAFGLILFSVDTLQAQKRVKGMPEALKQPKDLFESLDAVKRQWRNTANKDKKDPWIVISDRDKNLVYDGKSTGSEIVREIMFRELFYVVDEDEDWIKIATASNVNKLKSKSIEPIGWVPKERMLLWKSGLIDYRTKINKKAFLLNKAENIARVLQRKMDYKELIVDFFKDPGAQIKDVERTIYDYYFVFKKENGMYLIGEEAELSAYNIQSKLLGWVDGRNVEEWNTRISLEPNFSEPAFEERKGNDKLQFAAVGKESDVGAFVDQGDRSGIYWDNDPVKFAPEDMAKTNPRRFKGNVVRFPMFKKSNFDGIEFFRSGVIGSTEILGNADGKPMVVSEIKEQEMSPILEATIQRLDAKVNNINLFFLIEGTPKTYAFQQDIVRAINNVSRNQLLRKSANINYGALIYRDVPEGDQIIEYQKLGPDLEQVINFVGQADFDSKIDQDDYTALYYGLKQSLKVAGFSDQGDATNIIVMIGSNGDYSVDKGEGGRYQDAENKNHESLIIDKDDLFNNLSLLEAHLFSIQVYNDGRRYTGTAYAIQSQRMILNAAQYIYNKSTASKSSDFSENIDELKFVEPTMDIPVGQTNVKLTGSKPGQLILPMRNQSLKGDEIVAGLSDMVTQSLNYERTLRDLFAATYRGGEKLNIRKFSQDGGISVSSLSSGVVGVLEKAISESNMKDQVFRSTGLKLSVYSEVYIPLQFKGAEHPSCSFILFMPESDLLQYQNLINRNMQAIGSSGSYPEKRKSLFEMYMALVNQFAGEDVLRGRKSEDLSRSEVIKVMQGIYSEGLELDIDLDVRIGDLRDEKEVSNNDIDRLIQRFSDVNNELERIIKLTDRYDFCMVSDNSNRYYWLRMDQVF